MNKNPPFNASSLNLLSIRVVGLKVSAISDRHACNVEGANSGRSRRSNRRQQRERFPASTDCDHTRRGCTNRACAVVESQVSRVQCACARWLDSNDAGLIGDLCGETTGIEYGQRGCGRGRVAKCESQCTRGKRRESEAADYHGSAAEPVGQAPRDTRHDETQESSEAVQSDDRRIQAIRRRGETHRKADPDQIESKKPQHPGIDAQT